MGHEYNQQQRTLLESRNTVSEGAAYENAWKQLSIHIFEASNQDPALAAILKKEGVGIHPNPAGSGGSSPASTLPGGSPTPPKSPALPPQSLTP